MNLFIRFIRCVDIIIRLLFVTLHTDNCIHKSTTNMLCMRYARSKDEFSLEIYQLSVLCVVLVDLGKPRWIVLIIFQSHPQQQWVD